MANLKPQTNHPNPAAATDGDHDHNMMAQPQVFDLMANLNHLRRDAKPPMSIDEQAAALSMLIDQHEAHKRADRDAVMAQGGGAHFDEAAMEEAARALKRQRTRLDDEDGAAVTDDIRDARKVYAYGPADSPGRGGGGGVDDMLGLALDTQMLSLAGGFEGEFSGAKLDIKKDKQQQQQQHHPDGDKFDGPAYVPGFNILDSVCSSIWLATEVGKHLRPRDIAALMSASRSFRDLVRCHWQSTIVAWGEHMAPTSQRVFHWKFYARHTIQDPTGTTWAAPGPFQGRFPRPAWAGPEPPRAPRDRAADAAVRLVPGLSYLAMIAKREVRVRDILASLARAGHRMPRNAHVALKKVWLLMDVGTNGLRRDFIRSEDLWSGEDLYNAQLFFVKLQMRLNEPCFGPDCPALAEALLGSRDGLSALWRMLRGKEYTDLVEVVQLRARYHCGPGGAHQGQGQVQGAGGGDPAARHRDGWLDYFGVPAWDLGFDHLEGWGEGSVHLSRPDELVVEEAVRRGINLQDHLVFMVLWGHVDWARRVNLVPSEEEMYMSDDELPPIKKNKNKTKSDGRFNDVLHGRCGNVPFEVGNWLPVHALKARWDTLTDEEKRAVNEADAADDMKMLPWDDSDEGFFDPEEDAAARRGSGRGLYEDDCRCKECGGVDEECEACGGVCNGCGALRGEEHDEDCCGDGRSEDDEEEGEEDDEEEYEENEDEDEDDEEVEDIGADDFPAPVCVTDKAILAIWHTLTLEQKKLIFDAHAQQLARQAGLDLGTGTGTGGVSSSTPARGPARPLYPRDYKILDPTCLALLRKYDVFPPEVISAADRVQEEEDQNDEDDHEGKGGAQASGGEDGSEGSCSSGDEDSEDESEYADDEALKALADEEYSDDDNDVGMAFDVQKYKSYLVNAREDRARLHEGSEEEEEEQASGVGEALDVHMEGTEVDIPMRLRDTRYC